MSYEGMCHASLRALDVAATGGRVRQRAFRLSHERVGYLELKGRRYWIVWLVRFIEPEEAA